MDDELTMLVRSHAGLIKGDAGAPDSLVSGALDCHGDVNLAVESLIETLQRVNVELNGSTPSRNVADAEPSLPRRLVYAIAEIGRMLRDADLSEAAWAVDAAWLAVLSGDQTATPRD